MSFTFVHTADLHLDCPFSGIGDTNPELAAILNRATFSAWNRVVEICIENGASFLLVAGDVYNAKDRSLRAQLRFRDGLAALAERGIHCYVVHGNHDPTSGRSHSIDWPDEAFFFPHKGAETCDVVSGGNIIARVSGISYPKSDVRDNLSAKFDKSDGTAYSIGLLHCSCGQTSGHEPYSVCTPNDLGRLAYNYWALGHIHTRSLMREPDPIIAYPGNPQGLNPKETGPRGCYVVHVDDAFHTDVQFRETDVVRWFHQQVSIDGMTQDEDVLSALKEKVEWIRQEAERPSLARFEITGRGNLHHLLAGPNSLQDIIHELRDWETMDGNFVWVESIQSTTRPDVDFEERRLAEDFVADFLRVAQEMREEPDLQAALTPVLKELFQHAQAHKYLDHPTDQQIQDWLDAAEIYVFDTLAQDGE